MKRQTVAHGLDVFRFERLPADRVDAVVSSRRGGVSKAPYASLNLGFHVGDDPSRVVENRRRLFEAVGMPLERSVWCRQIHADHVSLVGESDVGRGSLGEGDIIADTDALITDLVDVPLCVIVADCVPVVVYDPGAHVLGIAHAGWAGTVKRIASATVRAMEERWRSEPREMIAAIGPSIGPGEYEVGEDVAVAARSGYGPAADRILGARSGGKYGFDLWTANRIDLLDAGLSEDRIEVAGLSSTASLDDFFSHRAEGRTGRFAAIAALRPR